MIDRKEGKRKEGREGGRKEGREGGRKEGRKERGRMVGRESEED